jgi:hypothetical protein
MGPPILRSILIPAGGTENPASWFCPDHCYPENNVTAWKLLLKGGNFAPSYELKEIRFITPYLLASL